ncbi:EXOCYST SUBUNIT EXO70 FAMILY PROTEIN [Salix koriyanagi]|uniref:Exocyst subunit Exo70 family protein n=1 Tax=Salix koriyanagi TaxID=2511006 RepID=A0A9Q0PP07_9ROSI|nr:EXOCYST SUBUNIT EXO70 FAMILY PROTEIN [Salix koriyanagi]
MEKHGQVASLCLLLVFDAVELLNETVKVFLMQLLNFKEVVAIRRRSLEKLFQILDMYDALSGVFPNLETMVMDEFVCTEVKRVLVGLGRATKGTFMEFENVVKRDL